MMMNVISAAVQWFDGIGLDYAFLLSPYDRQAWLDGIVTTLNLVAVTLVLSLILGVLFSAMLTSERRYLALPTRWFVELTRNTPTLVQIYFAVLVLNMLINLHVTDGAANNPLTAYVWVIIVLAMHYGALHAEALRAGIGAVPDVMRESARSMGFNRYQLLTLVDLPIATRFALPALVNNLVNLVKSTSLGAAVAVGEVTYASLMIWSQRDNVLELMILLLAIYSLLTWLVAVAGRYLEEKLRMPGYA
ncbi:MULTISPECIES: amino acid ABC transporter permease [unclassified Brenneria]|uniref:amino acid ABC transporter permease n=1 Tax=unclassified Brenneria TaxID=2634434 RepID=UPI00155621AA|nr:amino acid ABC transporter permease [Brenneria sp. hezel4-2-4]MEE3649832.1 amino acid ABC transporter permease [Brenneria sp. HEZEL_4_2_4]NPC99791.1 amino acid ABC transporter permease [Brenneria sp. hezel4-2-4]